MQSNDHETAKVTKRAKPKSNNWFMRFLRSIGQGFKNIGLFFVNTGKAIGRFFSSIYNHFIRGGWRTKLSNFVMGSGQIAMGRPVKGIIYLLIQIAYFVFMLVPGGGAYIASRIVNLGTTPMVYEETCTMFPPPAPGEPCPEEYIVRGIGTPKDNSMVILLYSVAVIVLSLIFFVIWYLNVKGTYLAEKEYNTSKKEFNEQNVNAEEGVEVQKFVNPLPTFKDELKSLLNKRFHLTTLTIPFITLTTFTILPTIFMILVAFTNYNWVNSPPNKLIQWVGFDTFKALFTATPGGASFGQALGVIVQWTFIWAFFATFTNYILGLLLAMVINRRSLKAKKLWRTVFVITIAVPQFVTLMLMSRLLHEYGPLNETLVTWGLQKIPFLTDRTMAKVTVILVNIWVGVPYTMLITSGILMNIPADLYESARIDGAGPIRQFFKITMPYILFVTGPYLITQFVGNINNFNVIFFLTGGGPAANKFGVTYGHTDILVTWLFNLTIGSDKYEYAIGSALGIFVFIISATITLVLYSRTAAAQQEGDFA